MEAQLIPHSIIPFSARSHRQSKRSPLPQQQFQFRVHAVLVKPAESVFGVTVKEIGGGYKDSWFDRIAINHLSKSVQESTGLRNEKSGYESFVDAAAAVYRNFNSIQQHQFVAHALDKAFPRPILSLIRALLPQSKFAREYFAAFTTIFFVWLVGPCEVRESELNGVKERNVVHIKKCRFLEETNCVGMCINLCKIPSEKFIKDSLGTPINMVPNFNERSCEMIFGQHPPPTSEDPALKQPCFKLCKERPKHSVIDCSS